MAWRIVIVKVKTFTRPTGLPGLTTPRPNLAQAHLKLSPSQWALPHPTKSPGWPNEVWTYWKAWCHKSWLGKADFTWLIVISHRYVIVSRYEVSWLLVLTWLRNSESLVCYDWYSHLWVIWCNDFHAWLRLWVTSFAHATQLSRVICFMFYDWLRRISRHDSVWVMTVMDRKVMSHQG